MILKKAIHPENVLGLRENSDSLMWKILLKNTTIKDETLYLNMVDLAKDNPLIANFLSQNIDEKFKRGLINIKKFSERNDGVYCVSKPLFDIFKELDREIPFEFIPNDFCYYLILPKDSLVLNNSVVEGCYVRFYTFNNDRMFNITIDHNDESIFTYTHKLSKIGINEIVDVEDDSKDFFIGVVRAILNCSVYLQCKDPEIEKLYPGRQINKHERESNPDLHCSNQTKLEINLIGWSFHGIHYSKDKTVVRQHLRYYKNNGILRVTIVKSHIRHFNKIDIKNE